MKENETLAIFRSAPVPRAVLKNALPALLVNLSRQGLLYIPTLLLLELAMGASGLIWAQPVTDLLSTALVVFLFLRTVRHMEKHRLSGSEGSS